MTIPGLVGAGDPRLELTPRPQIVTVLESGGRRDALLTIEAQNPGERPVRVDRVHVRYLEGDRVVSTVDDASEMFIQAGLVSDPRIDAHGRGVWEGLCLTPPTPAVDRARFEVDFIERHGLHKTRATQSFDVRLRPPSSPPLLALPVTGPWRITQGHTCETKHRQGRLGGEFAWDLAAVSETGGPGTPEFPSTHRNEDSATFGKPVTAPVSGTIVSVTDGIDDNDEQQDYPRRSTVESVRAPRWIFGNHVVVKGRDGAFVLLAHLKKRSIVVKQGDAVREGQPIAQAGNSGNTVVPHLHVQVMDRADPADPEAVGVPARFRDYLEVRTSRAKAGGRDAIYRIVPDGDPPEGSIVVSQFGVPGKIP